MVAEVAMTLVLLVVAGLLMQSLYRLRYADVGFRPDGVLTLRTSPPVRQVRHPCASHRVLRRRARARHSPARCARARVTRRRFRWRGRAPRRASSSRDARRIPGSTYDANHRQVSADYLQAIGIPLLEGRYFSESDQATAQPVVIVNQAMARQYWPGGHAIGKRIKTDDDRPPPVPWLTIVGVVGDVRQMGLDAPVQAGDVRALSPVRCAAVVRAARSRRPCGRRSDSARRARSLARSMPWIPLCRSRTSSC